MPEPLGQRAGGRPVLTAAQREALGYVRSLARSDSTADRRAAAVLAGAGIKAKVTELCSRVAAAGRVALNFHPDRIAADGQMVVEGLLRDGVYRNQFETGISNGGLGAVRDGFEVRLFAGAYAHSAVSPAERPRYGGLDLVGHPDGPCPRFGSCHLRLRREVLDRCSFSFGDSVTEPTAVGTIDAFEPVLAALMEAAEAGGHTSVLSPQGTLLGIEAPTPAGVVHVLAEGSSARAAAGRALDDYIEAQVHGPVRLADDVEALVADPSFRCTRIGELLKELASRFGLELSWSPGFQLEAHEVPAEFPGPEVRVLARRVAADFGDGDDRIDAEVLGRAARAVVTHPKQRADHGERTETLQHLKQLWHVLVAYGRPVDNQTGQ